MRVLIVYGTTNGQTARIAEHIGARMRRAGAEVVVVESLHCRVGLIRRRSRQS